MVSGTNDKWLRKEMALPILYAKMEPALIWQNYVRMVPEEDDAFLYRYNDVSMTDDTKRKEPPMHESGALFPELDYTRPETGAAMTESRGFSMRIPRKVIRRVGGANEIMKAYEVAGFWMATFVNTAIGAALVAGATSASWSPAVWSGSAAPLDDLLDFVSVINDREGFDYRVGEILLEKVNYGELQRYLMDIDLAEFKQKSLYGMPEVKRDALYIPVLDATIRKVKSGLTHSYVLGVDVDNPGGEYHYYNDPDFATAKVSYDTVIDGKKATQTVKNIGIHFDQFQEKYSKDTIIQFWYEGKAVVTQPYALVYGNGI